MKKPEDPPLSARDAEALFRTHPIAEIRKAESATTLQIAQKSEELRQLVGNRYRDLIDSADLIAAMKSRSLSISDNLAAVAVAIRSLSPSDPAGSAADPAGSSADPAGSAADPARADLYAAAARVKYLVDTTENIWGCLDESMFLEAAGRYLGACVIHGVVSAGPRRSEFSARFPLIAAQWKNVQGFRSQISQRARDRLSDRRGADAGGVGVYADALATVATIDLLVPAQALSLFLDSRRTWICKALAAVSSSSSLDAGLVSEVYCDVVGIIQMSVAQVGELFLQVLSDLPLFYKTVLGSPPGSQLFGGIPNPDEEVRVWKSEREDLESLMVMLDPEFVAEACSSWLRGCADEIVGKINGRYLIDVVESGKELRSIEQRIRETMESREALEGSLEWLRSVYGSEIESPWNQVRQLVLRDDKDLWERIFEVAFVGKIKGIINAGFEGLSNAVNVRGSIAAIAAGFEDVGDFSSYMRKGSVGAGVWLMESNAKKNAMGLDIGATASETDFKACLDTYFGPEISKIRTLVDSKCELILEDLMSFADSPKASSRLQELAPYLQDKCYRSIMTIVEELKSEVEILSSSLCFQSGNEEQPPAIVIERSLFIGRLLFALSNHSIHIPLILGSPRQWMEVQTTAGQVSSASRISKFMIGLKSPVSSSSRRPTFDIYRTQSFSAASAALSGLDDIPDPKLEKLLKDLRDLCIKAHRLWIIWVSIELSSILAKDIDKDDALSASAPLRGWEETFIKPEKSNEGEVEIKIALPCMPSLYITSFLFQACQEIHKVGGHVLDKCIIQNFAFVLSEKVLGIYGDLSSALDARAPQISEKGILQILFDLKFCTDVLSGGHDPSISSQEFDVKEELPRNLPSKSYRRKASHTQPKSSKNDKMVGLMNSLSQRLDPIDWATYEKFLWDNEKQSYQRSSVLFGSLVQLNRLYRDLQRSSSNTIPNIMRCSNIPHFQYLPISSPVLYSRGPSGAALPTPTDDASSRGSWNTNSNGQVSPKFEFDNTSSFGVATPLLFKSIMTQVGSRFGESTLRLGSMLSDGQVGRLKDKSVMSTFGDMLPVQAAGLLSSFTAGAGKSEP